MSICTLSISTSFTYSTSSSLCIYARLRLANCRICDMIKAQRRSLLFKGFILDLFDVVCILCCRADPAHLLRLAALIAVDDIALRTLDLLPCQIDVRCALL